MPDSSTKAQNNGMIDGQAVEYKLVKLEGGEDYEGFLLDSVPAGFGRARYRDGSEYMGLWREGSFHGTGSLTQCTKASGSIEYVGEFSKGTEHGLGILGIKSAGLKYQGQFHGGVRSGLGVEEKIVGQATYLGQFSNDQRHGLGMSVRPGMRSGQITLEKWCNGIKVSEGSALAKEFVGGLSEGLAKLAEEAIRSIALRSEEIAGSVRGTSYHAALLQKEQRESQQDSGQAEKTLLNEKRLKSELALEFKCRNEAEDLLAKLKKELKDIQSSHEKLQFERDEAVKKAKALEKFLLKLEIESEAKIAAQEAHIITVKKAQALEHENQIRKATTLYEDKLKEARRELEQVRKFYEFGGQDKKKKDEKKTGADKIEFKVVPYFGEILTDKRRFLETPTVLTGARRMACFGKPISDGVHTFLIQVEHLGAVVDGYVGIMKDQDPTVTCGFALRCDDNTLGKGSFGDSQSISDSRKIEDFSKIVLQIDADGDWITIHTPSPESRELARVSCEVAKPWMPAALCIHESSVIHLQGSQKAVAEASPAVLERVTLDWRARSKRTGIEYSAIEVMDLMLRIQIDTLQNKDLEDLLSSYIKGHQRIRDALWSRLAHIKPLLAPEGGGAIA